MRFKFMALYGKGSSGSDVLLDKSPEVPIGMKAPNEVVGAILEDMRMYSIKSTQKISTIGPKGDRMRSGKRQQTSGNFRPCG